MFLENEELIALTHKKTCAAQVRELQRMGVDHIVRSDGTAAVLKAHVENRLGATTSATVKKQNHQPNWSAMP